MNYRAKTAYEWIIRCYEWDNDQNITSEKAGQIADFLFNHAGLTVPADYICDVWKQLQNF